MLGARLRSRSSALIQFLAEFCRQIGGLGVADELQGADVRDDGPAIARGNLCRVTQHLAKAVRNGVVKISVGGLAETVLMIARRLLHAAHGHHAGSMSLHTLA